MLIAGIDPGLMTGVAIIDWDGNGLPEPPVVNSYEVAFPDAPQFFLELVPDMDLLVMERFTISARTVSASRQYEALYVLGGCMFFAKLSDVPVKLQSASDAKNVYTNPRLTELGWKVPGRHAKDALRHALLATHARGLYVAGTDPDESETA